MRIQPTQMTVLIRLKKTNVLQRARTLCRGSNFTRFKGKQQQCTKSLIVRSAQTSHVVCVFVRLFFSLSYISIDRQQPQQQQQKCKCSCRLNIKMRRLSSCYSNVISIFSSFFLLGIDMIHLLLRFVNMFTRI